MLRKIITHSDVLGILTYFRVICNANHATGHVTNLPEIFHFLSSTIQPTPYKPNSAAVAFADLILSRKGFEFS